jgi:hypothetical protein
MLQTILTYHVAGKMNASDIAMAIKKRRKGKATMKTAWWYINRWMKGKKLYITDEKVVCQWLLSVMLINQMELFT